MEWVQRNPGKATGLVVLVVLVVGVLVWGGTRSDGSGPATLGGAVLATPTATPRGLLTDMPTPSAVDPSPSPDLPAWGALGSSAGSGSAAHGSVTGMSRHHVILRAGSDGPLMAVGWWIPFADGQRKGSDTSHSRQFRHADTTYGEGDYAQVLAFGSSTSRTTWCTITVDGTVVERRQGRGPWAKVLCRR